MPDLTTLKAQLNLAGCIAADRIDWRETVTSTSDVIAALDDYHGAVCLTDLQTAGRGRRGTPWRAPSGSSILMSLGWQLRGPHRNGLSLVCGLAALDALEKAGVEDGTLKWPNDILIRDRKLGGILIELQGDRCIVGLGINLDIGSDPGSQQFPGETRTPWTDLRQNGHSVDRTTLTGWLIESIFDALAQFDQLGFAPMREQWQRVHAYQDAAVRVDGPHRQDHGVARGVDDDGALIVEIDGERKTFFAGDVSARPQPASAVEQVS